MQETTQQDQPSAGAIVPRCDGCDQAVVPVRPFYVRFGDALRHVHYCTECEHAARGHYEGAPWCGETADQIVHAVHGRVYFVHQPTGKREIRSGLYVRDAGEPWDAIIVLEHGREVVVHRSNVLSRRGAA